MGQNDVPEFIGDNFETFGTLPENINTHLKKGSQFCKELASVQYKRGIVRIITIILGKCSKRFEIITIEFRDIILTYT